MCLFSDFDVFLLVFDLLEEFTQCSYFSFERVCIVLRGGNVDDSMDVERNFFCSRVIEFLPNQYLENRNSYV